MTQSHFRVVSPAHATADREFLSLRDVLREICSHPSEEVTLVERTEVRPRSLWHKRSVHTRAFAAWALCVNGKPTACLEDAANDVEEWCSQDRQDCIVLLSLADRPQTILLSLKKADAPAKYSSSASTLSLEDSEKQESEGLLDWRPTPSSSTSAGGIATLRAACSPTFLLMGLLAMLLIGLILVTTLYMSKPVRQFDTFPKIVHIQTNDTIVAPATVTTTVTSAAQPQTTSSSSSKAAADPESFTDYIEFPTPTDNEGPRHQKYLLPSNVTEFIGQHGVGETFILRLDDQALMPADLVDEHEINVQSWFATNFPILAEVRNTGHHLAPSYLDYNGTKEGPERLLLNERYHIAHCVTAWRRYLRALRKGRHICPRDLDLGHLDHCTMQLESFAYRPRHLWGTGAEAEDISDRSMAHDEVDDPARTQIMLVWHTDVCF